MRLEQIVDNLLTNAIKYTPPGGRIDVTTGREDSEAVIRVRDNGLGIPSDLLPKIFDSFVQSERSPERADGGLGIGLTIVKQLVELHGGTVEALSDGLGLGTELVVRLPALPAAGPAPAEPAASTPPPSRARVLVVEDDEDTAEALTMLLRIRGLDARTARDGLQALEAVRAERFALILVDIGLPGMNGYEVARRLRRLPACADTLLVALTGYGRSEDRDKALDAGFALHLVKPVQLETLETLLARVPVTPSALSKPAT